MSNNININQHFIAIDTDQGNALTLDTTKIVMVSIIEQTMHPGKENHWQVLVNVEGMGDNRILIEAGTKEQCKQVFDRIMKARWLD